ncbi:hypothetical protein C488_04043 [Natrinema pellirubrum DSM 15624]|uniref:DUF4870 domain-containing protein n=1 Tax=Natrinema pellirubrum (strain DSM 15624 / CIP 106293 / JCM 10476 / NCIMB 786 / 157) TaxID=797303 RepID=L0JIK9_NATP1|nr:DUF4870 domain-containing protein [Natrinema pellirubrum]AGB30688.1 hypothetical protein Natpe_0768 [Natrinema pellirubrum DSM 15624]ELY80390.1 hypothetical protein C488_04043 [Natrinema pellirubrum DSM 15624]
MSQPTATTEPGPSILTERTLLGIFVHFIAILPLVGIVATAVIYLVSTHDFTRANARNALNWHLLVSGSFIGTVVLVFGLDALFEYVSAPDLLETVVFLPVFVLTVLAIVLGALSVFVWIVAMAKAIFGEAWEYPFAPAFVGADADGDQPS